jgi:hypothetical protein
MFVHETKTEQGVTIEHYGVIVLSTTYAELPVFKSNKDSHV